MSTERYARLSALFQAAIDLPTSERAAFLEANCGDDGALRREVESLLAADADEDDFIAAPIATLPPDLVGNLEEECAGQSFGAYRIIREIGRGGLGTVYLAERADQQFEKQVAIKVVKRGLDTDDILNRFRAERQILAQLDHPNIARLIDAGSTGEGLPYFVMEYVDGQPIGDFCEARKLSTGERLELFRLVCAAVTYAHRHLVIHRDIKPSNILVTPEGGPKLLDFGIAKVLHADDPSAALTMTGVRVMTPEYASPEQVQGWPISTSTDVYSLGVLLYELLTGRKPYRRTTYSAEELSRAVLEQTPERPSTVLRRVSFPTGSREVESRASSLRGDLDNIVLMALRKEPERRYRSVGQFSDDIRRHLEGLPVVAHKDTLGYRVTKFVGRNRIAVAAAAVVLLSLLGGMIATAWQAKRATEQARIAEAQARVASAERDRAQREGAKAQSINTFLQNILGFSDPTWLSAKPRGDAHQTTITDAIEEAARRAETELADQPEVLAAVHFSIGRIFATQGKVDRAEAHLRSSLEIRRRVLGLEHLETAQSMSALGEQLSIGGKLAEADSLLRETVTFFRRARHEGVADLKWFVIALNGLGNAQILNGDAAAGESLLRESLDATGSLSGVDRAIIPIMLSNLSVARSEQGDIDGSIAYLQQSLEEYRRSPNDLRLPLATCLANWAISSSSKRITHRQSLSCRSLWRSSATLSAKNINWRPIR